MPRRAARVTQADIARAIRAAKAVGGRVRIEIKPDGTIQIFVGELGGLPDAPSVDPKRAVALW